MIDDKEVKTPGEGRKDTAAHGELTDKDLARVAGGDIVEHLPPQTVLTATLTELATEIGKAVGD